MPTIAATDRLRPRLKQLPPLAAQSTSLAPTLLNRQPASNQRTWLVYTRPTGARMNHCEKRNLNGGKGHFTIGVSILLLALAVFGWGLHSKLSLYHIRTRTAETAPIAKLLSQRERPADTAQQSDVNHADLQAAALAAAVVLMPYPAPDVPHTQQRSHAPPLSSRTLALKGPSLRRPPPSLVA